MKPVIFNNKSTIYIIPYAVIILLGVWYRVHISGLLFLDGDSGGYFLPPIEKVITGDWNKGERPMQYLLFIYYTLSQSSGIKSTIWAQQALGVLSGVLLAISWIMFISNYKLNRLLWHLMGYIMLLIYMSSPVLLFYEQFIQPEAFCIFIMCALICSLVAAFAGNKTTLKYLVFVSLSIFINLYLSNPMPKWILISFFIDFFLIGLILKFPGLSRISRAALIISVHVAYAVVVWGPETINKVEQPNQVRTYIELEQMVFTHFDLLARDKANFGLTPVIQDSLEELLKKSDPNSDRLLGFSSDDLMWGNANRMIYKYYDYNYDSIEKYFIRLNRILVTRYPLELTGQIGKQVLAFYFPNKYVHKNLFDDAAIYDSYKGTLGKIAEFDHNIMDRFDPDSGSEKERNINPGWKNYLLAPRFPESIGKESVYDTKQLPFIFTDHFWFYLNFDYIFIITMLLFFALRKYYNKPMAQCIALLYIMLFLYVLTVSIIHTFDVGRFIVTIYPFILITTFMGLVYIFDVLLNGSTDYGPKSD